MARVHEIGVGAETRAFEDGIKSGVIRPVEDAVKAFEKLGDSVEKSDTGSTLSDMERDLRDVGTAADRAGRDGERGIDKLEDALRDAQRESEQLDRKLDDVGTGGRRGMDRVKEGATELQSEIGQNLGETVSSFRGNLSDLGQVGQDTLGGLAATVSSMGPAGLVGAFALAAGALGLGAVTAGLQDAEERQERLKEQAAEWAQAYVDAGSSVLNTSQIVSKGQELLVEKGDDVRKNAELWGVGVATAAAAMAGSQTAIDQVSDSLTRQEEALKANAAGADNYAQNIEAATTGQSEANNSLMEGRRAFDELTGAMQLGRDTASFVSQMLIDVARNTEGATEAVDEFGDTVITLPDGKQVYIDAETGQATQDVDAIENKVYGIRDKTVTVRADVSQAMAAVQAVQSYWSNRGITIPAYVVRQDAAMANRGWQ
jgi:chromosome segregation ATPase